MFSVVVVSHKMTEQRQKQRNFEKKLNDILRDEKRHTKLLVSKFVRFITQQQNNNNNIILYYYFKPWMSDHHLNRTRRSTTLPC